MVRPQSTQPLSSTASSPKPKNCSRIEGRSLMPDPRDSSDTRFIHRKDPFGNHLSFCRVCAQTVAINGRESKLVHGEETHKCEGHLPVTSRDRPPSPAS